MTAKVAAITGAYGYIGSVLRNELNARAWRTLALVREPASDDVDAIPFDLNGVLDPAVLAGVDLVVHAAWDLRATSRKDIWATNVSGSRRFLETVHAARVPAVVVISSIAAFTGTRQIYGRSKLAVEDASRSIGATVIRPGLVYGPHAGGLIDALRAAARLPLIPVPAAHAPQYTVHEADLAAAVAAVADGSITTGDPIVLASDEPVPMVDLIRALVHREGRQPHLVPLWWRGALAGLIVAEHLHVPVGFRADSLWGLTHPPPPPDAEHLAALGLHARRFDPRDLRPGARRDTGPAPPRNPGVRA